MTVVKSSAPLGMRYSPQVLQRAQRAFRCSPFRLGLLTVMRSQSLGLRQICDHAGVHQGYTWRPLAELRVESEMMWLIAVGLLRREVDGQGLTDSFRLTPLGHQVCSLLERVPTKAWRPPLRDRLYNAWCRWLQLPGWIQG
jgi:hypothetical protein